MTFWEPLVGSLESPYLILLDTLFGPGKRSFNPNSQPLIGPSNAKRSRGVHERSACLFPSEVLK